MISKKILLLILISFTTIISQNKSALNIPKGKAVTINGKISEDEWKDALVCNLTGGGKLFLMHDGKYFYAALQGTNNGWGHLYVANKENVNVLHASAALGKVVYVKDSASAYQPRRNFTWSLRQTDNSEETNQARQKFLDEEGWLANNNRTANANELEYKIALDFFDGSSPRIAVVYANTPDEFLFFPKALNDDCLKKELVFGSTPADLHFNFSVWQLLHFD